MNYKQEYANLIEKSISRNHDGYVENHHVIPKVFIANDITIPLTFKEHLYAHYLLCHITYNTRKFRPMCCAYALMCGRTPEYQSVLLESFLTDEMIDMLEKARKEHQKQMINNNPMSGKHHSDETKSKMSEANKGRNNKMYGKKGKEHPTFGLKFKRTKETRENISRIVKQKWTDPEYREKQSKKMSLGQTKCWADPGMKRKRIEKMKQYWSDPEKNQERSEKMKLWWKKRKEI